MMLTPEELAVERQASLERQRVKAAPAIERAKQRGENESFSRFARRNRQARRNRRSYDEMDWWEQSTQEEL